MTRTETRYFKRNGIGLCRMAQSVALAERNLDGLRTKAARGHVLRALYTTAFLRGRGLALKAALKGVG